LLCDIPSVLVYVEMARRRIEEGTRGHAKADILLRGQQTLGAVP